MEPKFISTIKGADLCESFFKEITQPLLEGRFPGLRYSAGLIGWGSDVLGYDDAMSTDHMWGPRFLLFLTKEDFRNRKEDIYNAFAEHFPRHYRGYSTNFGPPDMDDNGVRQQQQIDIGRVDPLVEYHTLESFFLENLGWNPSEKTAIAQWLTFSEYRLLGVTSGRVYRDDLGLELIRSKLAYYPRDIWLWMMASQWKMIAEEEPYVGRCGFYGDDAGSQLVAARQVQRLMRLGFLMEKRYAPYSKWLGTAFNQLAVAPVMLPLLEKVLGSGEWKERDELLGQAYTLIAERHNSLGLTEPLETNTRFFFERPFHVLFAGRFAKALLQVIDTPELRSIPLIGGLTQFTDSVTLYDDVSLGGKLRNLYE